MGLDRDGVSALLGLPDLIRREAPAEIWQYVAGDCVFEMMLYQRGADYAVSYLDPRASPAPVQRPRPCLPQLLPPRQAAPDAYTSQPPIRLSSSPSPPSSHPSPAFGA